MAFDSTTDRHAFASVVLGPQGEVLYDVPCVACGYDLRGLSSGQSCPECGEPISRSLHPDLLCFTQPTWIETLAKGMNWIVIAIIASVAVSMFGGILMVIILSFIPQSSPAAVSYFNFALTLVLGGMLLYGYWRVTTPDPRHPAEGPLSARILVRFCMTAGYVLSLPAQLNMVLPMMLASGFGVGQAILSLIGFFALFVYAMQLARRIPDPALEKSTRVCMWGIVVAYGMMMVGGVIMLLMLMVKQQSSGSGAATVMGVGFGGGGVLIMCGGLMLLVFGIWSLVLLIRYRKALNTAAKLARASWAGQADAI